MHPAGAGTPPGCAAPHPNIREIPIVPGSKRGFEELLKTRELLKDKDKKDEKVRYLHRVRALFHCFLEMSYR